MLKKILSVCNFSYIPLMMNSGRKSSRIDNFSERQYKFYFYYLMIIIYVLRFIMRGLVMCVSGMIIIYLSRFIMRGLVMCVSGMEFAYVHTIFLLGIVPTVMCLVFLCPLYYRGSRDRMVV